MGLIENTKKDAKVSVARKKSTKSNGAVSVEPSKEELAKKEKFNKYNAKRREKANKLFEDMTGLRKELVAKGLWDKLSFAARDFLIDETVPISERKRGGNLLHNNNSNFVEIWGKEAKVGDAMTLSEMMEKSFKGESTINANVKKWAQKGIIVEFEKAPIGEKKSKSIYRITALP